MHKDQVSTTAMLTNKVRANHQTAEPKILDDPVSVAFAKQFEGAPALAAFDAMPEPLVIGLESILVLRNRFVEDVLHEHVSQGRCQYAILGAGFDTFAYRQPAWAEQIKIFEIDHPATQQAKREVLVETGYALPSNLHYCEIDFHETTLRDALAKTPFDFDAPCIFSWLGVTQYITQEAFRETLDFVLSMPPTSAIVFSFVLPDDALDETERPLLASFAQAAAARGEPFISRYHPDELHELLRDSGFSRIEHLSPEGAQTRYFAGRNDALVPPKAEQLMRAIA